MVVYVRVVLLVLAVVFFLLAALEVPGGSLHLQWIPLGLAAFAGSFVITGPIRTVV
jgi:hypothetical protein